MIWRGFEEIGGLLSDLKWVWGALWCIMLDSFCQGSFETLPNEIIENWSFALCALWCFFYVLKLWWWKLSFDQTMRYSLRERNAFFPPALQLYYTYNGVNFRCALTFYLHIQLRTDAFGRQVFTGTFTSFHWKATSCEIIWIFLLAQWHHLNFYNWLSWGLIAETGIC